MVWNNFLLVCHYLNQNLGSCSIGSCALVVWPPRSPEMASLDLFLWDYINDQVFTNIISATAELKTNSVCYHFCSRRTSAKGLKHVIPSTLTPTPKWRSLWKYFNLCNHLFFLPCKWANKLLNLSNTPKDMALPDFVLFGTPYNSLLLPFVSVGVK